MDKGYVRVRVLGARLYAHRVAWLLMTGVWPDEVDHVNRDRADNRWHNLRSGSHLANMQNVSTYSNNTTGFTGVYRRSSGWVAHSRGGSGTRRYLGHFKDVNDAIAARKESENAC